MILVGPSIFTVIGYLTLSAIPYESPLTTRVRRIRKKARAFAISSSVMGRGRGSSVAGAGVGKSAIIVGGGGKSFAVGGTDLHAASKKTVNKYIDPGGSIYSVVGLGGRSSHIFLNQPDYVVNQHNGFGFLAIDIEGKELDAKYYDIGYKCKEQKPKESDLEEGDFTIFDMSSCKIDNSKNSLKVIDHYSISKSR